jgi:ABC-type glycerol-3-phosphate transport system permease component
MSCAVLASPSIRSGVMGGRVIMITIPALIFFVAVQRYLIRGWGDRQANSPGS